MSLVAGTTDTVVDPGVAELAAYLVDGGRVVPGASIEADGRARS
ncbi:MAG: hypothetical protein ACK5RL_10470 [Acidimicrobiales bacterium]